MYREKQTYKLNIEKLGGNESFEKNESLFAKVISSELSDLITDEPTQFKCYPNPFDQEITIDIQNAKTTEVTVDIYNLVGQKIITLYNGANIGHLVLKWNGTNSAGQQVVPGMYMCKVNEQIKKVIFRGGK